jgi:hypothetical protein
VPYQVESYGFPQINLYPGGQTGHWSIETAFTTIKKRISTFDRASTRRREAKLVNVGATDTDVGGSQSPAQDASSSTSVTDNRTLNPQSPRTPQ